jgi:hypothetical protein
MSAKPLTLRVTLLAHYEGEYFKFNFAYLLVRVSKLFSINAALKRRFINYFVYLRFIKFDGMFESSLYSANLLYTVYFNTYKLL